MKYHYFVSYALNKSMEGVSKVGMEEISRDSIVSSMEDILSFREFIAKKFGFESSRISIINYNLIQNAPYQ